MWLAEAERVDCRLICVFGLVTGLLSELLEDGTIKGSLSGNKTTYTPHIYTAAQSTWINTFFTQNGYLGETPQPVTNTALSMRVFFNKSVLVSLIVILQSSSPNHSQSLPTPSNLSQPLLTPSNPSWPLPIPLTPQSIDMTGHTCNYSSSPHWTSPWYTWLLSMLVSVTLCNPLCFIRVWCPLQTRNFWSEAAREASLP